MNIRKFLVTTIISLAGASAMAQTPLVTFVCTGNTGRSPMAEALAKNYIDQNHLNIQVQSRGVEVDPKEVTPENGTVTVLKERGIDIATHKAHQLTKEDVEQSSYLLTMGESHKKKILENYPEAKSRVFTLAEFATGQHEELSDPYGKPIEAYRKVEGQLDQYLPKALDKIAEEAKK